MKEFESKLAFLINNSKGLFEKLQQEYLDFDKDHLSSRHAINAAITSWHLTDWTYQEFYKNNPEFQDKIKDIKGKEQIIRGVTLYQQYLSKHCPSLELMRLITNGSKHCILNDSDNRDETGVIEGEFHPKEFYRHEFFVPQFVIKNKKGEVGFEEALLNTISFWKTFLEEKYNQVLCSEEFLKFLQIYPSSSRFLKTTPD